MSRQPEEQQQYPQERRQKNGPERSVFATQTAGMTLPMAISTQRIPELYSEVDYARLFHRPLPAERPEAIAFLLNTVRRCLPTAENIWLFVFNPQTLSYTCLNNELIDTETSDRLVSDPLVKDLPELDAESLQQLHHTAFGLQSYLFSDDGVLGALVASSRQPFLPQDELTLKQLAPYVAPSIQTLQRIKQLTDYGHTQHALARLATRLVEAPDTQAVIQETLGFLSDELGFAESRYGILSGGLTYRRYHGQHKLIETFDEDTARLAQAFVQFRAENPKANMLEVSNGAIVLPVFDAVTGQIQGLLHVLLPADKAPALKTSTSKTSALKTLSSSMYELLQESAALLTMALNRTRVLEKAMALATTDELTGLANRRGFYNRAEGELERARRNKTPVCLALIDIDHFKAINDTYGHPTGDRVLQQLAEHLTQNTRKSDVLCRFGGEEFALLLPETPLHAGRELLERIRVSLAQHPLVGALGETLWVTLSAGVTEISSEAEKNSPENNSPESSHFEGLLAGQVLSQALAQADQHLYSAKTSGRNRVI